MKRPRAHGPGWPDDVFRPMDVRGPDSPLAWDRADAGCGQLNSSYEGADRRGSACFDNGSCDRRSRSTIVAPGSDPWRAWVPHFSQWPRYMLRTLVQMPASVYRKPMQVLSGFSIDKIGRVDLGNPVLPRTFFYTQLPPEGNSHFWAKRPEMGFPHGCVAD